MNAINITTICKACADLVVQVTDAELAAIGVPKGDGLRVDAETATTLLTTYASRATIMPGGVGANTVATAAILGSAAFIGKVGDDEAGYMFAQDMHERGIPFRDTPRSTKPTACVFVFVTPDGERSIVIPKDQGASADISFADIDANRDILHDTQILFLGMTTRIDACTPIIDHAIDYLSKNTRIAATLQGFGEQNISPACLKRLAGADIILGSQNEFSRFLNSIHTENILDAAQAYPEKIYACTLGKKGAVIASGENIIEVPARPVTLIDGTGAGDAWAGGFLHGLSQNMPLEQCADLAATSAAHVLGTSGGRLPPKLAMQLRLG